MSGICILEAGSAVLGGVGRSEGFVSTPSGGKRCAGRIPSGTVCCVVSADVDPEAVVSLPGEEISIYILDLLFIPVKILVCAQYSLSHKRKGCC